VNSLKGVPRPAVGASEALIRVTVFLSLKTWKCILHATPRPWLRNAFLLGETLGFSELAAMTAALIHARDLGMRPQKACNGAAL
jgi:hypothetical protein